MLRPETKHVRANVPPLFVLAILSLSGKGASAVAVASRLLHALTKQPSNSQSADSTLEDEEFQNFLGLKGKEILESHIPYFKQGRDVLGPVAAFLLLGLTLTLTLTLTFTLK
jgi:hypothetical protein